MAKVMTANLRRLANTLALLSEETDWDMTLRQLNILMLVAKAGDAGMQFESLVRAAQVAPSAVSRTVRKLGPPPYGQRHEGLGLLDLQLDPHDSRRRIITITDKGWDLLRRAAE